MCIQVFASACRLPGQDHHHGIQVNGTVCHSLQHELLILEAKEEEEVSSEKQSCS